MSYQGDSSLSVDIQDRVLNTFDQTAKLAQEGKLQEAQLGCDFILRLDPHFEPAKSLQDRLGSADGPLDLSDLQEAPAPVASPEVLKTVALSPQEIEKLMAADEAESNGSEPEAPPAVEAAETPAPLIEQPRVAEPEPAAAEQPLPDLPDLAAASTEEPAAEPKRVGKFQTGSSLEAPGVEEKTAATVAAAAESQLGGGDRIQQLLDDGQSAFDGEKYQEAIDSWSRIFLIDIDHAEASKRIELARQLKEEREREVEEIFHEGVAHADEGRTQEAITAFEKVLEMQPNHLPARELLDNLGLAPEPAAGEPLESPAEATVEEPAAREAVPDATTEPRVPPGHGDPGEAGAQRHADESFRMVARAKRAPVNRFALIGGAVAVLVVIGAVVLFANWASLFPNSNDTGPVPQPGAQIVQITKIYQQGEIEAAIAALEEIGTGDPDYPRAQRLVSRWQGEFADAIPVTPGGEDTREQSDFLTEARGAYGDGRYLKAARSFSRASAIAPLNAAEAALYDDSKQQLEPIAQQIDLFNQRQYELALAPLWRQLERDSDNRDVIELLVNSYHNMAVRDLRRGEAQSALTSTLEARKLAPGDPQLERLEDFAQTYTEYPRDLLYAIYVQQLEARR
ncbi:MAG: hypothetical protein VYE73_05655 [Acidobacteriota bacterium]|nr:hypothetical protein [Acidobacteriota bacterium]